MATEDKADVGPVTVPRRASLDTSEDTPHPGGGDPEKGLSRKEHGDGDGDVAVTVADTADPNIVDWDGPDDPENPLNWPARKKWTHIILLATITTLT